MVRSIKRLISQANILQDLEDETRQALQEGHYYSANYKSGEIFRLMRQCHYNNDSQGVQLWRSKLTPPQDQFLNLLLKRNILITALDSVIGFHSLWRTFYIGSLDVIFFVRGDEVSLSSLLYNQA